MKKLTIHALILLVVLSFNMRIANSIEETGIGVAENAIAIEQVVTPPQPLTDRERYEQLASRGEIRSMNMEITAYTSSADECGKDDGITASGEFVRRGIVATDSSIPFGTILYIEGVGEVVVKDRGGAITEDRVDLYVPTKDEAFNFGRQTKKVYFIGSEIHGKY